MVMIGCGRGDAAATREVKEFAQAVKEALEEYLSRKGVSAGGFQPVNTLALGKATAARGTGGIVRKGVSVSSSHTSMLTVVRTFSESLCRGDG